MKVLKLNPKDLMKIVSQNEIVGCGCYGIIYKIDEETLFKFNYKDFINDFEIKDNKNNTRKIGDISETISIYKEINYDDIVKTKMVKLTSKQKNVKLTKLTKGIVVVDDFCIGFLLDYHKNMVNVFDYLKESNMNLEQKKKILGNLKNAVKELCDNYIYLRDLTLRNVMFNPKTNEIQLIDFEDALTEVREERIEYLEDIVKDKIERIENFLINDQSKEL